MLSNPIQFVNPLKMLSLLFKGAKKYQADIILAIGVLLACLLAFAAGYITREQQEEKLIKFEDSQNEK